MDESNKNSPCKECKDGVDDQLHKEVDHLRQHLAERDAHFITLEAEIFKSNSRADELEEQVGTWREKYERLYDSHKRVQKLNQVLEDKLLQMVDKMKTEKSQLTKDIATLSVRLAESKHNYSMLQKENERYKNDMNLAIQLLQCKPDNFVSQKLDNLPADTQARVSQYVMSKTPKATTPTQSKASNDIDTFDASEYEFNISASLMSKILEDSIQDSMTKHCDTCSCSKSQNKPFCYNESYYSTSTQTNLSGEIKKSLCSHCNAEIKSMHSILTIRSESPHGITIVNEKTMNKSPLYILPQPVITDDTSNVESGTTEIIPPINNVPNNVLKTEDTIEYDLNMHKDAIHKLDDEYIILKKANSMSMEPAVHHKLCDRTKTSISSKKSSILSVGNEDLLIKEFTNKDAKPKNHQISVDINNQAKGSHSSMGACSRTSSVAKSTVSTHKSHTQVGPGPRFCHLRVQAGSKNILLDNAEPDVPPVLYRRQSKCHDNSIFKDINDDLDNFIDLEKNESDEKAETKNESFVVETTLIDVHVDNNNKEACLEVTNRPINPVLLNVSSSPLQPLKTHNYLNNSEYINNNSQIESQKCTSEIDTLLNDFNVDTNNTQDEIEKTNETKQNEVLTPNSSQEIKIFNFDRYEQSQVDSQYTRPIKKIDMSKLHTIENTKISKDMPPLGEIDKDVPQKPSTPNIVNVYPNLTQTRLKTNEIKNIFTNEQSTSSMSSDDSAAMLQKQQLLRVAEWVEKNLEQQNNLNDPLEEECSYSKRITRRESKISRLTETLNELALNMPHPVSKYSKSYSQKPRNSWIHNSGTTQSVNLDQIHKQIQNPKIVGNVVKETIFPVECDEDTITEINNQSKTLNHTDFDIERDLRDVLKAQNKDKTITPEDLAKMEYNVKKFLLSGPYWANPRSVGRSRRTSSKTETDV